jgi:hypothetical protein
MRLRRTRGRHHHLTNLALLLLQTVHSPLRPRSLRGSLEPPHRLASTAGGYRLVEQGRDGMGRMGWTG